MAYKKTSLFTPKPASPVITVLNAPRVYSSSVVTCYPGIGFYGLSVPLIETIAIYSYNVGYKAGYTIVNGGLSKHSLGRLRPLYNQDHVNIRD
jgi:hypothetical protein